MEMMLKSQQETAAALAALAAAIGQQPVRQPRITNTSSRRRGGGRGGGSGRSTASGQKQLARPAPAIVEVRDVASQKEVAERATIKNRIRTALRQMSLSIFDTDSWLEVPMRRWYNAALRALDGLTALDFPAGSQREDFLEQVRQVAYAFNIGAKADEPKAVLCHVARTILSRHDRDAFYEDGHVKIQSSRGQPYGDEELGRVELPGFPNVKLSNASTAGSEATDKMNVGSLGWEILNAASSGEQEATREEERDRAEPAPVKAADDPLKERFAKRADVGSRGPA